MDPIYLDYAATTPVRPEVRDAMAPYLDELFANPSSPHGPGRRARAALEEARNTVAGALGVKRGQVFFVRGGTESDNLAILGRAAAVSAEGGTPHVVTLATEHKAVLDAARAVEAMGGVTTVLPVDRSGVVDMEALRSALAASPPPSLLSVMWVNNETGVVQDMTGLVEMAAAHGVPVHTDAVQAVGKVPVPLSDVPVCMASLTGHKIYGPKSTGVLVVRNEVELAPRIFGGSQEGALRPGTQDVAGAVGMARAVELMVSEQPDFARRTGALRERLVGGLASAVPEMVVHGAEAPRAPHILNVGVPGASPEILPITLDLAGLAVSAGSACQSGSSSGSHVLAAMLGSHVSSGVIRFSIGKDTTEAEIDAAAEIVVGAVARLEAGAGGLL